MKTKEIVGINQDLPYPKLMKQNWGKRIIVLFTKYGHGTVLKSKDPELPIGEYRDDWSMDAFDDFGGKLIMIN